MGRATLKAKALKSKGKGINENSSGASTYVKPKGKKELKRETRKQNLMRSTTCVASYI